MGHSEDLISPKARCCYTKILLSWSGWVIVKAKHSEMLQKLINFIRDRTCFNRSQIAEEAGINVQLFSDVLNGARELPLKHIWNLSVVLSRYGLEIHGFRFEYDETNNTFFLEKKIPDREVESVECSEDGVSGVWYEYRVWMRRALITDNFDLIKFFEIISNK